MYRRSLNLRPQIVVDSCCVQLACWPRRSAARFCGRTRVSAFDAETKHQIQHTKCQPGAQKPHIIPLSCCCVAAEYYANSGLSLPPDQWGRSRSNSKSVNSRPISLTAKLALIASVTVLDSLLRNRVTMSKQSSNRDRHFALIRSTKKATTEFTCVLPL